MAIYQKTSSIDWTISAMKLLARAESVFPFDKFVVSIKELHIEHQVELIDEGNFKDRLAIYQKWEAHLLKGIVSFQLPLESGCGFRGHLFYFC